MRTIKNKGSIAKLTSPARAIHSIIVPLRKKNRPPQIATQDFQNRTFSVKLFPNVCCSISELPDTAAGLLDVWRKITNNDIRYQQRCNAIPAFLGCRDVCCKFSSAVLNECDIYGGVLADYDTYPYLRITLDNIQVAVFIIMQWCRRTGQMPLTYSVVHVTKGNKLYTSNYDLNKSNPYLFEQLILLKDVHSIAFGAAAEIVCTPIDRQTDLYNIPNIRVSQKFGHQLNTYAMRHIKEVREALQRGEIKKMRNMRSEKHRNAIARIEYNERKAYLTKTNVGRSYYGGFTYNTWAGSRYERARNKGSNHLDAQEVTIQTNEALAKIHAPELLTPIVEARDIIDDFNRLESALKAEHKLRLQAVEELENAKEEAKEELKKVYVSSNTAFRNNTQLKNYALSEASIMRDTKKERNCRNISKEELSNAINTIVEAAENIEIDRKTGQLVMKF